MPETVNTKIVPAAVVAPGDPIADRSPQRELSDAHGVIPFVFSGPNNIGYSGLYLQHPLNSYVFPEIDVQTGRWKLKTTATFQAVKKTMAKCGIVFDDLIRPFQRDTKKIPLREILKDFERIDNAIVYSLNGNKTAIAFNAARTRDMILEELLNPLTAVRRSKKDDYRQAVLQLIERGTNNEHGRIRSMHVEETVGLANEGFNGIVDFTTWFSWGNNPSDILNIRTGFKEAAQRQEEKRVEVIVDSIRQINAFYAVFKRKFVATRAADAGGQQSASDIHNVMMAILKKQIGDKAVDTFTVTDNRGLHDISGHWVELVLHERIEILYNHLYCYFTAVMGKTDKARVQANAFLRDAVFSALQHALTAKMDADVYAAMQSRSGPNVPVTQATKDINAVIKNMLITGNAAFNTHLESMIRLYSVSKYGDKAEDDESEQALRQAISSALFGSKPESPIIPLPRPHLNELRMKKNVACLTTLAENRGATQLGALSDGPDLPIALSYPYRIDPVRDAINKAFNVADMPVTHVVFRVLHNNQCFNPHFMALVYFKEPVDPRKRRKLAAKYMLELALPASTVSKNATRIAELKNTAQLAQQALDEATNRAKDAVGKDDSVVKEATAAVTTAKAALESAEAAVSAAEGADTKSSKKGKSEDNDIPTGPFTTSKTFEAGSQTDRTNLSTLLKLKIIRRNPTLTEAPALGSLKTPVGQGNKRKRNKRNKNKGTGGQNNTGGQGQNNNGGQGQNNKGGQGQNNKGGQGQNNKGGHGQNNKGGQGQTNGSGRGPLRVVRPLVPTGG